ncbi:hypothetical protein BDF21DRAFT_419280 [Thamnidium elegans]|nr:hypothetical protein BDF21DRAFT_419280 [Thamnidium elegans]
MLHFKSLISILSLPLHNTSDKSLICRPMTSKFFFFFCAKIVIRTYMFTIYSKLLP